MKVSWRLGLGRVESVLDYAGVLVPLREAHLHSHAARTGADAGPLPDADDEPPAKAERRGMLAADDAAYSVDGLRREMRQGGGQRSAYEIKSRLVSKAIQDIGMGPYNWQLFGLCGLGWFADNLWLQGVSLCLPSLSAEFGIAEKTVRYTTSALFAGLAAGSVAWGVGSDLLGRRLAFNLTLLVTGVFGLAAAGARSWPAVCALLAALGSGVGGNLPVDGALFLEFLPDASGALLTLLSVWWPAGQLAASLAAWYCMARWPVDVGWRCLVAAMGAATLAMFAVRFFLFHLLESPKFLLSRGRQAEAVAVVHGLAFRNGTKTWLTSDLVDEVAADDPARPAPAHVARRFAGAPGPGLVGDRLRALSCDRLRPLFRSRTLGVATALVWFCWAAIGMGYPLFNAFLPQYLSHRPGAAAVQSEPAAEPAPVSADTYRSCVVTSLFGVPGSLLAAYLVDHPSPLLGRRGTLAVSTLVSALFLFLFVACGTTPAAQLALSCVEAFSQNIMYGVLYAFTPEMFPAPVRGAGTGVASFLNRLTGLMAPVLAATVPGDGATTPVYVSAVLILAAFVAMCLIPIETRGGQRL